jgi:hypothetical protein
MKLASSATFSGKLVDVLTLQHNSTYIIAATAINWYWTIPLNLGYPKTVLGPDLLVFWLSNLMKLFLLKGYVLFKFLEKSVSSRDQPHIISNLLCRLRF